MALLQRVLVAHKVWRRYHSTEKLFWWLPHLVTCLGVCCGFASLIRAGAHDWRAAAYYIFAAACFDMLDGRIARALNVAGPFGVQLDSLADALSFCIAPAYLVYEWCSGGPHGVGLVAALIFVLAGLLRLARFNVTHTEQRVYFIGLPTTGAALIIAGSMLILARNGRHPVLCLCILLVILGLLMVSSVRVPTLKVRRSIRRPGS